MMQGKGSGSDFYYSRLSANEKKIWDRLDKACMDVLLSDDDADALIYVDVRDLGVKNDKADFLTLLFIYLNPQYFFLNECGATPDGNGNAVWASVGMYPDFEQGFVQLRRCDADRLAEDGRQEDQDKR